VIDGQIVTFSVVAALLTMTPGPDTMLVARNVLRGGRRDGVLTTFGACSGLFVHALLSALGVSAILTHSAVAFQAMKVAGASYLIWLGLQSLRSAARGGPASEGMHQAVAVDGASSMRSFSEGFLSNVLNPKVAVFYLAFLPQFIGPGDPVLPKSLLLAGIHYVEGMAWLVTVAAVVARTRRVVLRSALRRWLDGVCGAVLIGLGVRLAFERR
jgi:RhtB (resistance to homoserine/threonine) family protein